MDDVFKNIMDIFAKFPGVGRRSAKKIFLHLIKKRNVLLPNLIDLLLEIKEVTKDCEECRNISTKLICEICASEKRDHSKICVVQEVSDIWSIEGSLIYFGTYHVLGGLLSAINEVGPQDINIHKLITRIKSGKIEEIIFALNVTTEGQTTIFYISDLIAKNNLKIKITTLAQGIPIGGDLEYLDMSTISLAFNDRKLVQ